MKKRILSFLVAAVMIMSLLPSVVSAAEPASVSTLEDLQAAITAGTTEIVLTAKITVTDSVTISADKATTITTAKEDAFTVTGGTLTLGANITVNSNTSILWANGGDIVVKGAKLISTNSNANVAFAEVGTITVKSGEIQSLGKGPADAKNPAPYGRVALSASGEGVVIVDGGWVYADETSALKVKNDGTAVINGGVVETSCPSPEFCAAYAVGSTSKITMNGGTVAARSGYGLVANVYDAADKKGGSIIVNDGIVNGGVKAHESATSSVTINGGLINGSVATGDVGNIVISGGTFSVKPDEKYLDEDFELVFANGGFVACDHSFGEWYRDGKVMVRECINCPKKEYAELTAAERVKDNLNSAMKYLSTKKYAVVLDTDEGAVVTNNTNKKSVLVSVEGGAAYRYLADVKYAVEAADGYEITAVYLDGKQIYNFNGTVTIKQIKNDHVITVVTEAVEEAAIAEDAE